MAKIITQNAEKNNHISDRLNNIINISLLLIHA